MPNQQKSQPHNLRLEGMAVALNHLGEIAIWRADFLEAAAKARALKLLS